VSAVRVGRAAILVGVAGACFVAGVLAGRIGGGPSHGSDLGELGAAPGLLFDASTIRLLPDASLELRPMRAPDVGDVDAGR
jgi:hypothetical protein